MSAPRSLLCLWALAAMVVACDRGAIKPGCVPGQSVACAGPGACSGAQVCAADGMSFGPCVCAAAPVVDAAATAPFDAAPTSAEVLPVLDGEGFDLVARDTAPGAPAACRAMGIATVADFDSKFLVPRCGTALCHGPMSVFPPRDLHRLDAIRPVLVDRKGLLFCKNDFYINRARPLDSYLLATVTTTTEMVTCPSGGQGGGRMPNKDGMPTIVGPRLSEEEIACFTWWVIQVAAQ
jgi:hypothetical protein